MGKMLTQQRRGKGSTAFRTPGHRYLVPISYPQYLRNVNSFGQVTDILDDVGRSTLVAKILLEDGKVFYNIAPEGIAVGDKIDVGSGSPTVGSVLPLSAIPDGTKIYNLEAHPGGGGKIARSSGSSALIVTHDEETGLVNVQLSSKRVLSLSPKCFASIGTPSIGGRLEKPFKKAGNAFYAMNARNKYYPHVRGTAMNAVDHPHGGRSFGKSTTVSRHAPPGRKVGQVAARSTGRSRVRAKLEEESK